MKNKLLIWIYSIRPFVLFVLLFYAINLQAQIVYTDIEPDFTSENFTDFYNLDLNNDAIVDFTIKSINEPWAFWAEPNLNTNNINAFITVSGPFWSFIVPLNKEYLISENLEYPYYYDPYDCFLVIDFCETYPNYCSYGGWRGKIDKYIGLRFRINGMTHYGWARLYVTSSTQWIIKDYAYNATPNESIFAGQKVLGVEKPDFSKVKVVMQNGIVSVFNLPNHTEYNLFAINGQKLAHGYLDQINNRIAVQNLLSGIYLIELISNNSMQASTRKFIIP